MSYSGCATILVEIDFDHYTCEVDYTAYEDEPCVPYYPDGSGYPGSPPKVEVTGCTVIEAEFCGSGNADDPDNWNYRERAEFGDFFDGVCLAELEGGEYDDELLGDAAERNSTAWDDGEF